MVNPRFPNKVKVYRIGVLDTESVEQDVSDVLILDSVCRNDMSQNFISGQDVWRVRNVLSLPLHSVDILAGDRVEIKTHTGNITGIVENARVGNLGANVWYREIKQ